MWFLTGRVETIVAEDRYKVEKYLELIEEAIQLVHPQHEVICEIGLATNENIFC